MEPRIYGDQRLDAHGSWSFFLETKKPRCFGLLKQGGL